MKRAWAALALLLATLSCASGSGDSPPVCVGAGQSCVPSAGADACTNYLTSCDATSGAQTCVAANPIEDGGTCGTGKVCLAHTCITACVPGVTCTPTSPPAVCKSYATACSEKFTATSCAVGANQLDGTSCGSDLVCSSGACVAKCAAGLACTPAGSQDPCKTYATECSSDLSKEVCAPALNQPDTTSCAGGTGTCQAGVCTALPAAPTLTPTSISGAPGLAVTITVLDPAAVVYYTTDGTPPSDLAETLSSSFLGSKTLVLQSTATIQAFAKVGVLKSATVVGLYTIVPPPVPPPPLPPPPPLGVSLGSGFTEGSVQVNGVAQVVGSRLVLTPNTEREVASAFYPTAMNVQTFTTDFSFQILNPDADGLTFTIQGTGPYAMGSQGGGLGYGPDPWNSQKVLHIDASVAIKFDTHDNEGEGRNSTGLYTDGAPPTLPSLDLTPSGIDLHAGRILDVHIVYDGTILTLRVTDKATVPVSTFTAVFPIDIPAHVGDVTGYVGFTASTGARTESHQIINWTYSNSF